MKPMTVWTPSNEERSSILHLHQKQYDGYAVLNNKNNMTPLTTQDYILDKNGMTLSNKGEVKGFVNFGINESVNESSHDDMCEQCGGMMAEGECSECGYMREEDLDEQMYGQDLYDSEDLDPKAGFDYIEGSSNDVDTFEGMHKKMKEGEVEEQYDEVNPAYAFQSGGPEGFEKPKKTMGLEDMFQLQQDELDYESQHDGDPDARDMIADLDDEMNDEYSGMEDFDDEKEAYDFRSGGPFGGGAFYNEGVKKEHKVILEMFKRVSQF